MRKWVEVRQEAVLLRLGGIGGNDFRLVTEIVYATHKVFIRFVGTHQEYDRGRWK